MCRTIARRLLFALCLGLSGLALAASRAPAEVSGAGAVPEPGAPAAEVGEAERAMAGELLARAVEALGGAARLDASTARSTRRSSRCRQRPATEGPDSP